MKSIIVLFISIIYFPFLTGAQNQDSIYCNLVDFLKLKNQIEVSDSIDKDCSEIIILKEITSGMNDLSVDFGVYVFESIFVADGNLYYLVKFRNEYVVFSTYDQVVIINYLIDLMERYPEILNCNVIVEYIKYIGKKNINNMGSKLIVSKNIGSLKYIYSFK